MDGMLMRRGGKASGASAAGGFPISNEINFYDYDGTLLYGMTINEVKQLTELPPGPDHTDEELVFAGWNWDLADLKALTVPMDVGALYDTAPHEFKFKSKPTSSAVTMTKNSPIIVEISPVDASAGSYDSTYFFDVTKTADIDGATIYIDWAGNAVTRYTFSGSNNTVISFNCFTVQSGDEVTSNNGWFNNTSKRYKIYIMSDVPIKVEFGSYINKFYVHSIKCGSHCKGIFGNTFYNSTSKTNQSYLTYCVTPNVSGFTLESYALNSCYALKTFIVPKGCTNILNSTLALTKCTGLIKLIACKSIGSVNGATLESPLIERITFDNPSFKCLGKSAYVNYGLKEISINGNNFWPTGYSSTSDRVIQQPNPTIKAYVTQSVSSVSATNLNLMGIPTANYVVYTPKS